MVSIFSTGLGVLRSVGAELVLPPHSSPLSFVGGNAVFFEVGGGGGGIFSHFFGFEDGGGGGPSFGGGGGASFCGFGVFLSFVGKRILGGGAGLAGH